MNFNRYQFAVAVLCGCWLTGHAVAAQPNVVILLADDLGWNAVGYHSNWVETPNNFLSAIGIRIMVKVVPIQRPLPFTLRTGN